MGTELERRGLTGPAPIWSAAALIAEPDAVRQIHRHEVAAGADILTANTFRVHRRALAARGRAEDASRLAALAVRLAREAAAAGSGERHVFVVGSQSPLEDCYRPDLVPDDAALEEEHDERARDLEAAGADGILLETHNSIRELAAGARAARATGLPVIASMVTGGAGHLLSGEDIAEAVAVLLDIGVEAVGINCVPARTLEHDLRVLAGAAGDVPLAAYGNLGRPAADGGYPENARPEDYAAFARSWLDLGVRVLGGCCGTRPSHTAALRRALDRSAAAADA